MKNIQRELTDYVVPRLVDSMGVINCSDYILRHTTHDKQAFDGDRSVLSNLSTIKLQYYLPKQMEGHKYDGTKNETFGINSTSDK